MPQENYSRGPEDDASHWDPLVPYCTISPFRLGAKPKAQYPAKVKKTSFETQLYYLLSVYRLGSYLDRSGR